MSRLPVLDIKTRDCLVKHIKAGNYIKTACYICGVNPKIVQNILDRGHTTHANNDRFIDAILKAEAEAEAEAVATMRSGRYGWQSAARYLESRHKEHWKREENLNAKISVDTEADIIALAIKRNQQKELKAQGVKMIENTMPGYSTVTQVYDNSNVEVIDNASKE